jgi:hypothetical protein
MSCRLTVLCLFPSGAEEEKIKEAMDLTAKSFRTALGVEEITLTPSSTWCVENIRRAGSWDSLVIEAVQGKQYSDHKPHFSGFVAAAHPLGEWGARVIDLALSRGVSVFCLEDGKLLRVERLNAGHSWVETVAP